MLRESLVELLEQPRDCKNQNRRANLVARTVGAVLAEGPERGDVHDVIALINSSTQNPTAASQQAGDWAEAMQLLASVLRGYQEKIAQADDSKPRTTIAERILSSLVGGPRTPKQMARQVGSPLTSVTRALRMMEADGLIALAERAGVDKREKPRELTEGGRVRLIQCGVLDGGSQQNPSEGASTVVDEKVVRAQLDRAIEMRRAVRPDADMVQIIKAELPKVSNRELRSKVLGELLVTSRESDVVVPVSEGNEYLNEILELSERDDRIKARALYELARWIHAGRLFSSGLTVAEALEGALSMAKLSGDLTRAGWCNFFDATLRNAAEDLSGAHNSLNAAMQFFEEANDTHGVVSVLLLDAKVFLAEAQYAQAINCLENARGLAVESGLENDIAQTNLWLGEAYIRLNPGKSFLSFLAAAKKYRGLGNRSRVFIALSGAETARFLCNDEIDADVNVGRLQRAIRQVESDSSLKWWKGAMLHRAGVVERELGMEEGAIDHLQEAVKLYRSTDGQRLASGLASLAILVHNTDTTDRRRADLVASLQKQISTALPTIQASHLRDAERSSWYEHAFGLSGEASTQQPEPDESRQSLAELKIELSSCR
ncbi:hypothetical protein [Rhodococcus jostii]|uniref:hypothetical protein n=1 Tax=Rhodococcus jostii TaxID=132919 RepID=UPI00365E1F13